MREKELRIALVCFGGVSLAIYMHGISKEILKLVRASERAACDRRSLRARRSASFFDRFDRADPEYDTEEVYFDLLREIGRSVELRVVVDIIAGASAGGINGTMLARALSHDLPDGQAARACGSRMPTSTVLLAPDARAGTWSKWFLKPLIWLAARTKSFCAISDLEVRAEAVAVRALALVQAAARWPDHGRVDVRCGHLHGTVHGAPQGVAAAVRSVARPVRHPDRLLRLSSS